MTPKDIQAIVAQIQAEDDAIRELLETDPNAAYTRANANLKRAKQTGNDEQIMYCAFTLGLTALEHRPYPKLNEVLDAYKLASKKALAIGNNQSYGGSQNNLGEVYRMLPSGDREENLKNAIDCYQNALRIRTEKDFPQDYAATQNSLGIAYADLPTGDRGENLKYAIACYKNALRIFTEKDFSDKCVGTLYNLALAYDDLNDKQNAYETCAKAIKVLETRIRPFCHSVESRIALSKEELAKLYNQMVALCISLGKTEEAIK